MIRNGSIGVCVLIASMLSTIGCAGSGPKTIIRDRFEYTSVLSDSWKDQMLLNIVRLRYGDAPIFLEVASVINSYEFSRRANVSGNLAFQPDWESGAGAGIEGAYINRPTITYSPLSGEMFAKSLMTPIPITTIFNLVQAGYPADLVFRVFVQSINGINNRVLGRRSANPDFYDLLERLKRIQDAGAVGLRIGVLDEGEVLVLVFRDQVDEETEADIVEARKLLRLDPDAREFTVVYSALKANAGEIAILSRSMLQVLNDLSSFIEVPENHVAESRVNPTLVDEYNDGEPVPPLVRIRAASHRPEDAFVAVPYNKTWFWIDNRDRLTKQIFSFLMFSFTLVETGGRQGVPSVTVPVR